MSDRWYRPYSIGKSTVPGAAYAMAIGLVTVGIGAVLVTAWKAKPSLAVPGLWFVLVGVFEIGCAARGLMLGFWLSSDGVRLRRWFTKKDWPWSQVRSFEAAPTGEGLVVALRLQDGQLVAEGGQLAAYRWKGDNVLRRVRKLNNEQRRRTADVRRVATDVNSSDS